MILPKKFCTHNFFGRIIFGKYDLDTERYNAAAGRDAGGVDRYQAPAARPPRSYMIQLRVKVVFSKNPYSGNFCEYKKISGMRVF